MSADQDALVSTDWLAEHLTDPGVVILDCTWHHPSTNLDGRTQYRGRHLPGAVHFDIDQIADLTTSLPHMLPTPEEFAKKVGLLGVSNDKRVVVYDRLFSGQAAARAWWMFRVFGHDNVAVLDGGYAKWQAEKKPGEMSPVRPAPATFTASFRPELVRSLDQMKANLASHAEQVVDARGPAKFDGSQADVFPAKKPGHIPEAINLPWGDLIDDKTGGFVAPDTIKARFAAAGVDLTKPIVTTCGSGTISCSLALALRLIGVTAAVYDGSFAEWGLADDTPIAA